MKNGKDYSQMKLNEPSRYYHRILSFYSESFPGVNFEYKLRKKVTELREKTIGERLKKCVAKVLKNLRRALCPCFGPSVADLFVKETKTHHKLLQASFWIADDAKLTYFIFLNPILLVTFLSGSYLNILVDTLFLTLVSYLII